MNSFPPDPRRHRLAVLVQHLGLDAGQRQGRAAGLGRRRAGERRHHDSAGLGLPPGVDDGAAPAADDLAVPDPGLGVDRLTHRAQQPQAGQVVLLRMLVPEPHEGADGGRRGVEDGDLVPVDHVPEAVRSRRGGGALVHEGRRVVHQRAVDDVAVPGDPAHVRGAPVGVRVLQVEHPAGGERDVHRVAAGGVEHALRLPGRCPRCRG